MDYAAKERFTRLVLYGFLRSCTDHNFHQELEALAQDQGLQGSKEDQVDGVGHSSMASSGTEETLLHMGMVFAHQSKDADLRIDPSLVRQLAEDMMNPSLSEEDRSQNLVSTLQHLIRTFPEDAQNSRTMLLLNMLITKRVALYRQSLLQEILNIVVKFIIDNLFSCLRDVINGEMN